MRPDVEPALASDGHNGQILGRDGVEWDVVTSETSQTTAEEHGFEVIGTHPDAARRLADLVDIVEVIRPVVAADGGDVEVVSADVEAGIVRMRLTGSCGSCAVSSMALNQGIDRILRDRLDWVNAVLGEVQESDVSGYGGWTPKSV